MRRTEVRPICRRRGDFALADAGAVSLSDFGGIPRRGLRPRQAVCHSPGLCQASPPALPQNLAFEFSEDCEQAGHGATGCRDQIQGLGQRRRRAGDSVPEVWLSRSVTDRPERSRHHTSSTSISRRCAVSSNLSRASRIAAQEPTSHTLRVMFQSRRTAYSRMARFSRESVDLSSKHEASPARNNLAAQRDLAKSYLDFAF